jgi:hypothetical protein
MMTRQMRALVRAAVAATLLSGCLPPISHGTAYERLPPKASMDDVEVFTDARPERAYREVGHIDTRATSPEFGDYGRLITDARRRAAGMGADAIIVKRRMVRETETVQVGNGTDRHHEMIVHEIATISAVAIAWTGPR